MATTEPIIIIGAGLAGYNVARELRKLDKDTPLTIIADDAADFYSKPMLSNALAKNRLPSELPTASAEKMAEDLSATILPHTRVTAVDTSNHIVTTADNTDYSYSKLVMALGASAIRIHLAGNAMEQVHTANDLQSYAGFRKAIEGKQSVTIIGAGLIGCEFANDLVSAGCSVTVIDIADYPLANLLPEQAGRYLQQALSEQGVNWKLGKNIQQLNFTDNHFSIDIEGEAPFTSDAVLCAVGLQPNTALAEEAGLAVKKGIIVNRYLQTSNADVYALGDCAEVEGLFLPYVMPLMNAARTLAKTLAGEKTAVTYPAMPVLVKTPACPLVVAAPARDAKGQWQVEVDKNAVRARFESDDGQLLGFALMGEAVSEKQKLTTELPAVLA